MKPDFAPLPRHVAVIMDGNGRWAERRGLPRLEGHRVGAESVRDLVEACAEWGVPNLTLYAFSRENWRRPDDEVEGLMAFLEDFLGRECAGLVENRIRLRALGRIADLPAGVREALRRVEEATAGGDRLTLRLALSYGGRTEIVDAARELARRARAGEFDEAGLEALDEDGFAAFLYDPAMPDPDLVIRTAGEERLSNFLLWQVSYAELHFSDKTWPEFRRADLLEALRDFHRRTRRFGGVPAAGPPACEGGRP